MSNKWVPVKSAINPIQNIFKTVNFVIIFKYQRALGTIFKKNLFCSFETLSNTDF